MPAKLYDAHCHWTDQRLRPHWDEIAPDLERIGLAAAVVNGTCPDDWPAVLERARHDERILPAVGLHPWKIKEAPNDWKDRFIQALEQGAGVVGEIGLDQWIEDHDIDRQLEVFHWQLDQAAERGLPVSIHCLKATGPLLRALEDRPLPGRGIHIHALNAPLEVFERLLEHGAFFSFNAGQLKPNAKKVPAVIRSIPGDRLLIETDAPDFRPPETHREFQLPEKLCHPANLRAGYAAVAELLEIDIESLAKQVEKNFEAFFHC